MAKGVTNAHCGHKWGANAGGVGCQAPGPLPVGGGTVAPEPSLARQARIWSATDSPQAMPALFCGPFRMAPRIVVLRSSKLGAFAGKRVTSTLCAAALAAASLEALAGTALCTK